MKYLNITDCDIANGLGVRVTLYVSGCSHCCLQCHNPESWNPSNGVDFTSETLDQLIKLLKRPYIDGLTLSGGDPLFMKNRDTIEKICKKVKEECPDKNIWLYTGYKYEDIQYLPLLNNVDYIVDGKFNFVLRDITLAFRGSSNQRIVDIKETKKQNRIVVLDL